MQIHDLKIDPQPFADLVSGAKTCEVRNDDRGFEVGDTVRFPGGHCRTISHIQRGYGLPDGLCVLSYAQASASPEQGAVTVAADGAGYFRKRPVVIQAIEWTGGNLRQVITFTDGPPDTRSMHAGMKWEEYCDLVGKEGLKIYTLEGVMKADVGDFIIKGIKGEHYPCKPDVFSRSYEIVDSPLYTHADDGEIERLRAENKRLDLALAQADHNYDCDRQQFEQKLADAQALLREVHGWIDRTSLHGTDACELMQKIDAFLSATAQTAEGKPQ